MKRKLLLILIVAFSLQLLGNPVDENTAKQLAQNFWKENNIMGVKGDKVFKKRMSDATFVNIAPQCGYSEFYLFNNEGGKGFVIIAADDCVAPILAYSYENNFATDTLTPEMKWWLDGYAEQIQKAVALRSIATDEIQTEWESLMQSNNLPIRTETAVNPLITTTWGQGEYYNAQCPSLLGFHTPTGCVATAMAQIMKYWNYPTHGYNYHSYPCRPYGIQSANFAGTNYQWSSMPNSVTSPNNAVATLMYHCGVSVEMDYGIIHGSGAQIISYNGQFEYCAENAFKTFFGYSQALSGIERQYNESNWTNIIKNELNNSRPILYGGSGTGGHAFVCDGYNNSNYFHFNWGWNGESNGYYTLNNLNPMNGGEQENYTQHQHALIGIQPDNNLQNYNLVLLRDIEMLDAWGIGNFGFGQDISMYTEILNQGNSSFSGYVAAVVFDDDGYFIDFLGGGSTYLQPNYYIGDTITHAGGIPFLPSYDYLYHTIMFYSTDGEHWSMVNSGSYDNDAVFQVFNNGEAIETNSPMTFSNGEEDVLFNGQSITINVEVLNQGNYTYNDGIWLALLDSNENYVQIIDVLSVNIPVDNSVSLNYTDIITAPEGQYYLALLYYYPENHARYVGSVFYPSIKRVYVINPPYTISATANPNNGGVITGGGTYNEGETCVLTATANNGYSFVNWTENGTQVSTNATYSFVVSNDRNFIANFQVQQQQQCSISVLANPTDGGSVSTSGDLSYNFDDGFSGWTTIDADGDGINWKRGSEVMTTGTGHGHNGSSDLLLSQSYSHENGVLYPDNYLVSPQISLGGSISFWACAQDNAYPAEHFGVAVSTTSNTDANSFLTIQEWTMTAKGEGQITNHSRNGISRTQGNWYQYTVDLSAFSGQTGYIAIRHFNCSDMFYFDVDDVTIHTIGGNTYYSGQSCTVHAIANSGYNFVNWTENGIVASTNPNYTFTVTSSRNLVANFQAQQYTISVSANPSNGGSVSGGGTYTQGQTCTISATANNGFSFVNWTENGVQVSTNTNYTFQVTGNRTLVANFQTQSYTVSVAANPSNGGSVSGGGSYEYGQTCTVTANAVNGYNFINWTENGVQVSTNTSYSFTVAGNRNLVANFTSQSYVITATADPSAGGVITGSGGYNYGETCTLTATANTGYTFVNWTKNGTQVSTNSTYSITVTESATYVAHFNIQSYSITVAAYPNNAGSVTGGGTYNYGQTCTVHATANSGFTFTNWTENGSQVSTNDNYSFTVTNSRNLVANFTQSTYTIQASAGAYGTITPSGPVTVAHGANQMFSMIPDADYEIQEVYIDGNPVGALTSYTFTNVTANHYIHVSFAHVEGIEENTNTLTVYPNPTSGIVNIDCHDMVEVKVFNALGVMVKRQIIEGEDNAQIDLSAFSDGLYILQAISPTQTTTIRVVKAE